MRRLFPLLMLFALAALLTGCEEKKKYRICVSQCSQDDWRMKMNDEINREILLHDDATVEICSADDSSEKQIADIRRFMQGPCDILSALHLNHSDAPSRVRQNMHFDTPTSSAPGKITFYQELTVSVQTYPSILGLLPSESNIFLAKISVNIR